MAEDMKTRACEYFKEKLHKFHRENTEWDVEVIIGNDRFKCHKIILAAHSEYFENQLLHRADVNRPLILEAQFTMRGVDPNIVKNIINYCYTGQFEIKDNNYHNTLEHVHAMKIEALVDKCRKKLKSIMNSNNCLGIVLLGYRYRLQDVIDHYDTFTKELQRDKLSMVALGGLKKEHCNIIEIYDSSANSWFELNMDINRTKFSSVFFNNDILIIGGWNKEPLNTVESVYLKTWTRSYIPSLIHARCSFTASVVEYSVYVVGGIGYDKRPMSSVESYNLNSNTWTIQKPLKKPRCLHGAAVVGENIHIVGGKDENDACLALHHRFSTVTGLWQTCTPMKEARIIPGVVAFEGFIYAIGGFDGSRRLSTIEKYDPYIDRWSYIAALGTPHSGVGAVILDNVMLITGGHVDLKLVNSVQQYDFKTTKWDECCSLNRVRSCHTVISVSSTLLN